MCWYLWEIYTLGKRRAGKVVQEVGTVEGIKDGTGRKEGGEASAQIYFFH